MYAHWPAILCKRTHLDGHAIIPGMQTFFWHDYETSGADPWRDRPLQFAGIRTTMELEIVGEPVMFFGKPRASCRPPRRPA